MASGLTKPDRYVFTLKDVLAALVQYLYTATNGSLCSRSVLHHQEKARKKMVQLYSQIQRAVGQSARCFRAKHCVTIISEFPNRKLQIILRLYRSPSEVLVGFDVDCCSVGYNGHDVYMTPRAHAAIVKQRNTVDVSRRSPSYEHRLAKYAVRGFEVLYSTVFHPVLLPVWPCGVVPCHAYVTAMTHELMVNVGMVLYRHMVNRLRCREWIAVTGARDCIGVTWTLTVHTAMSQGCFD